MAAPQDDNGDEPLSSRGQSKKRRIPGACDICKRKKIRCDSGEMPDNKCTNCVQCGWECTHKEVAKTLGSAKGYVESLEGRLEKMDRLLSKLLPGIDVNREVDKMDSPPPPMPEPEVLPRNDDDATSATLTTQLSKLTLNPRSNRYFGKSSGYQLVQVALDLKQEYIGEKIIPTNPLLPSKRHEFWDIPAWVKMDPNRDPDYPNYAFPDEDLIPSLVDAYFTHINPFLPLLHRQTFEKSVAEREHYEDPTFAGVLLLVCAHGARYSDDPRVLASGSDSSRSAGWMWYEEVNVLRKNLFKRTTLYELQMHALHVLFAQSSETPQGIWAQIGLAVRLSQEVGAHRKRNDTKNVPNVEDELWKRAFWVLMTLDRHISTYAGRPCALQDEDFDLDLPLECDDEYWEHGFQQPPDKPSSITFFNCYLRLTDILAYAMRLIYAIKRPRNNFGRPQLTEQQIIAELDSAMNNWIDSVPAHLRWNPNCDNPLFLKQSAALYATYYYLQIFIHRPFIPSPRNPIPIAFPSLAICTNAARSCCHVLESYTKLSALPFSFLQNTAFTSAVILLLNIWSGKRSGYAPNPKREMEDVQRCREVLKSSERRWASAGRYWDILTELAFAGDVKIPNDGPPSPVRKKRARSEDDCDKMIMIEVPGSPIGEYSKPIVNRNIVGINKRISPTITPQVATSPATSTPSPSQPAAIVNPFTQHQQQEQQPAMFSLPMYSNELGRLPVYGQFNFSDTINTTSKIPMWNVQPAQGPAGYSAFGGMNGLPVEDNGQLESGARRVGNISCATGVGMGNMGRYMMDPSFQFQEQIAQPADRTTVVTDVQGRGGMLPLSDFSTTFGGAHGNETSPGFDARFGAMPVMDNETMTMWNTAPTSLELDDWNNYISNVGQLTQARAN